MVLFEQQRLDNFVCNGNKTPLENEICKKGYNKCNKSITCTAAADMDNIILWPFDWKENESDW